jgi:hypothetical protein
MRKIYRLMTMMTLFIITLTLVSCDEEQQIAAQLQGHWSGEIRTKYNSFRGVSGGNYYTVFRFDGKPGSRGGHGYEIDYANYRYDSRTRIKENFNYSVADEVITIIYEGGAVGQIRDYRLDGNTFEGYLDFNNQYIHFRLEKDNQYRDDPYVHGNY